MASIPSTFDPIAVVVDWLDACRQRRLADLVELYDEDAIIDCCTGARFQGRSGLLRYWTPKLEVATPESFQLDEIQPEGSRVWLDYGDHDGRPVRTTFRFDSSGKIVHTTCLPAKTRAA